MKRKELSEMIPKGYKKVIAERAGVSQKSVSQFMQGKTRHSLKIERIAFEVLAELKAERNSMIKNIR